ncbi:argininosuccinate lyase [Chryseobacterium sp. T16E-39]|uniref:argininosuccinate lyase n=1 Tax=Chryseobacterium sp. T16E-39 TaxID=2015076 RepID=UPI0012FCBC1D|nr:argininosuccinate lyase [Chryseobacterium sp. T16E-39]
MKKAETNPNGNNSLQDASRIGRTSVAKAPEFQELYDYETKNETLADAMFPYQSYLHKGYVIMLAEQNIISKDEAKKILKGLQNVDELAENDPALRLYLPYESALIKEIGNLGGKMHIGRSRNDMDNTTNRMFLRDRLLDIISSLIQFRIELLSKASGHLNTVMVAYTHRKEAQPITFAHYLTAIDESFSKSLDRYIELYTRMDECPLGAGATGGTSWPINRARVGELLGFKGLVSNTIEGVAGWDHISEFASDNAIYMSSLSRFASEIQLWSTDEYRSVELNDAFAGISSMMPQKKNPDALERSRKAAANSVGQLMSILTSVNAVEYQHSGTRSPLEPKSLDAVLAATHAMTGLTKTLQVNKEQMLKYARENFSTMTDLADLLVRKNDIDFRDAHEIIADVVNLAITEKKTADKITIDMIKNVAAKRNQKLNITNGELQEALDPVQIVTRKVGLGMPAPTAVQSMIDNGLKDISSKKAWLEKKQSDLQKSNDSLRKLILNYTN